MTSPPDDLRSRLLAMEPLQPDDLDRVTQEIKAMFEPKLTRISRTWWIVGLLAAVVFAAWGSLIVFLATFDVFLRVVWIIYTLANVAFIAFAAHVLITGTLNLRRLFFFLKISPAGALLVAICLFARAAVQPSLESLLWAGFGVFCLGVAMAWALHNRINLSDLSTREHLLRLEYRVLEMADRLSQKK